MERLAGRLSFCTSEVVRLERTLIRARHIERGELPMFNGTLEGQLNQALREIANVRFVIGELQHDIEDEERAARSLLHGWPG